MVPTKDPIGEFTVLEATRLISDKYLIAVSMTFLLLESTGSKKSSDTHQALYTINFERLDFS